MNCELNENCFKQCEMEQVLLCKVEDARESAYLLHMTFYKIVL